MTERQKEVVLGYAACDMNAVETRTPVWYGPRRRRGKHETGISTAAPEAA